MATVPDQPSLPFGDKPARDERSERLMSLGEPGGEGGVAPHVVRLLAGLGDVAHYHVFDQLGIEVIPLHQSLEWDRRQVDGMDVLEDTVAAPTGVRTASTITALLIMLLRLSTA